MIFIFFHFYFTRKIITQLWSKLIEEHITPPKGAISSLQELTQAKHKTLPEYQIQKIGIMFVNTFITTYAIIAIKTIIAIYAILAIFTIYAPFTIF